MRSFWQHFMQFDITNVCVGFRVKVFYFFCREAAKVDESATAAPQTASAAEPVKTESADEPPAAKEAAPVVDSTGDKS